MAVDVALGTMLEQGGTLPAHWYSDPAIHALERELVFARTWQFVGPTEWLDRDGAYFAARAAHIPVVVVRDGDELRAFVNVCRHRGHLVARDRGCQRTLQCPYHAWTYGLDGTLRNAPRAQLEADFDPTGLGLLPVAVDTFGPLVFVNPDPAAAPLAGRARPARRAHRRERRRPRRAAAAARRARGQRLQLEDGPREHARVLPLPGRPPRLLPRDRRGEERLPAGVRRARAVAVRAGEDRRRPAAAADAGRDRRSRRSTTSCSRRARSTSCRAHPTCRPTRGRRSRRRG